MPSSLTSDFDHRSLDIHSSAQEKVYELGKTAGVENLYRDIRHADANELRGVIDRGESFDLNQDSARLKLLRSAAFQACEQPLVDRKSPGWIEAMATIAGEEISDDSAISRGRIDEHAEIIREELGLKTKKRPAQSLETMAHFASGPTFN